ncbi:MAG: hypothetical protein RL131_1044 [Bacteroidota bacterium]
MPALQLSGLRHLIGGGCYVLYFGLFQKQWPKAKQIPQIIWMAILMFVLSNGLSVLSVVYLPSGLGSVVGAIAPIWVVLFSLMMFKHIQFKKQTILGIAMGFIGVVLAFYDFFEEIQKTNFYLGIVYGLISSITWALATLLTVKHAEKMNPYFSLGWQMFTSGVLLNLFAYGTGNFVRYDQVPLNAWLSIGYLVIVGSVLAFGAYIYALKRLPATLVSVHAYINPIVALILGTVLMQERMTLFVVSGAGITLWGVYLVNNSFRRKINFQKQTAAPATTD